MSHSITSLAVAAILGFSSSLCAQVIDAPSQPNSAKPGQIPHAAFAEAEKRFDCRADVMNQGVTALRLLPDKAVWEIPCDLFAYNTSSVFAYVPADQPGKFRFLDFQAPPGRTRDDPHVLINAEWNAGAHTVTSFAKGRGLGDCGTYEVHKLVDQRFQLLEFREKKDCDGIATPPAQYKLVYRAR